MARTGPVQLCRQGVFPGGSGTNVGLLKKGNHPQVLHFLKSKQGPRLKATARAELRAVLAEDATEIVTLPDTVFSSEVIRTPVDSSATNEYVDTTDVPTQIEGGFPSGQEGVPDVELSSPFTSGDAPAASPSVEIDPSVLNGAESSPATSPAAVDALQSAGEDGSVDRAALSAQEEYLRLIGGGYQGAEQVQTDDLGDSLKAAQEGFNTARDASAKSVEDVVNALRTSVDSAGNSVKNAYDSVNGSIVRVIKSVTAPFDKNVDELQSGVDNATQGVTVDFTSVFRVGTPANDGLKEVVTVVKSATGSALEIAGSFITQAYSTTKDNVPPEFQSFLNSAEEKVAQFTGSVGSAIDQVCITELTFKSKPLRLRTVCILKKWGIAHSIE